MAEASTVAAGVATGIMMAGAVAASANVAGTTTVFEAADLSMKALGTVAANFMEAVDSTEVVEAFTVAQDFMAVAATEVAMGTGKGPEFSSNGPEKESRGRLAIQNCQPFFFGALRRKTLRGFLP